MRTRGDRDLYLMIAHTITPGDGLVWRYQMTLVTCILYSSRSWQSMLLQTSSNCSCRYISCNRPHFLTQCLWCGCKIHYGHMGKMSLFSAVNDSRPFKFSTAFHMTLQNPLILYSVDSHGILTDASKEHYDAINSNPGRLQFNFCQNKYTCC